MHGSKILLICEVHDKCCAIGVFSEIFCSIVHILVNNALLWTDDNTNTLISIQFVKYVCYTWIHCVKFTCDTSYSTTCNSKIYHFYKERIFEVVFQCHKHVCDPVSHRTLFVSQCYQTFYSTQSAYVQQGCQLKVWVPTMDKYPVACCC